MDYIRHNFEAALLRVDEAKQDYSQQLAKAIQKLENRRNAAFVWATKDGFVVLDDMQFTNIKGSEDQAEFKKTMKYKISNNPKIIVSLKADNQSKMSLVNTLHTLLKDPEVNALKLSYSALRKSE